jgi:hypothetical protein
MNRLPRELFEQLRIRQRQPLTKFLKPIFDKGQVVIRLPTAFNPELNISEEHRIEATLVSSDPPEVILRVRGVDDVG